MNFPKTLKIGAYTYKIFYPYTFDNEDQAGQVRSETCEIKIAGLTQGGRVKDDLICLQCFFHEVLHAINQIYCMNQLGKECDTEELIDALAEGMVQVLVDNKMYNGKVKR